MIVERVTGLDRLPFVDVVIGAGVARIVAKDEDADRAPRVTPTGDPFMSPSRAEKIDTCERAYGFRYLDRLKAPAKPAAAFGTAVHAVLEAYFKFRFFPVADAAGVGQAAIAGLAFLPLPRADLGIEHEFDCEVWPGLWFTGVIDVYDRTRACAFQVGSWKHFDSKGRPIPLVIDHKTTGDFKWKKSGEVLGGTVELRGDAQAAIYGWNACVDFLERYGELPEEVHFRWVYYLRSKNDPQARPTDVRMTPQQIRANVERWKDEATRAIELHKIGGSGHDLAPKLSGCKKFGGCEYGPPTRSSPGNLNICRLTDGERLRAAMSSNIPLNQQVNAFLGKTNGAPPPVNGSPFGSVNPPEARAAPAASPFGAAATAPAPAASPFGAAAAPAPASVFGAQAPAAATPAPQAAPAAAASPFGAVTIGGQAPAPAVAAPSAFGAFAAQAPAVDPRLAECLPSIEPSQRVAWLAHCEQNGLDYKTGNPRQTSQVAVIPSTPAPATQEATDATWRGIAQRMYDEGRALAGTEHPEVQRFYNAICTMNGPPKIAAPAVALPQGEMIQPAKKARKKRSDAAGAASSDEDESPQILITDRAIVELITWLQSLRTSA